MTTPDKPEPDGAPEGTKAQGCGCLGLVALTLLITVVAVVVFCRGDDTPEATPATMSSAVQSPTSPTPTPIPSIVQEVKALYEELQGFKYDREFRRYAFGVCCRFNKWKSKVEELHDRVGLEFAAEFGFLPGDLVTLGLEYALGSYSSEFVVELENTVEAALAEAGLDVQLQLQPVRERPQAQGSPRPTVDRVPPVDRDAKCREASHTANYSDDFAEMTKAMDYFGRNCTWENGRPVAR